MAKLTQEHTPRWLVYCLSLILGVVFSLAIFLLVWNKSLHSNNQNFLLETVSIREKITRNLVACENISSNIQNLLLVSGERQNSSLKKVVNRLYENHEFIEALQFHTISSLNNTQKNASKQMVAIGDLTSVYKSYRNNQKPLNAQTIIDKTDYIMAVNMLLSGEEFSISSPRNRASHHFVLFSLVKPEPNGKNGLTSPGLLELVINTEQLFKNSGLNHNIAVTVSTESRGLSGRQVLLSNEHRLTERVGWLISTMQEQHSIQLPSYSIRFLFKKNLYWKDIDQALIVSTLIVGLGVTLLIIALVRSKELQARELSKRNMVIQKTVDEQTKELALARDKAVDASRVKSEFLASMSHEIRTPLNAIIGISELMAETELNDEQSKYVKIFRKAGDNLLSLVNDILDLSKIEAKQLVLEAIPFSLISLVEESVDIYAIKASEKNIRLIARVEPGIETNRVGDPTRLRQIILNLISNALKFTEKGEILVSVEQSKDKAYENRLIFSVKDSGIGIAKDKLEAIFLSFTQVDSSTTRKYGGTGLGLTISKSLVHMMNGRIWVESEVDKGSTFSFSIDLEHAEIVPAITGNFPVINLADQRILVVDDNSTNRLILKDTLQMMKAQVVEAASGQMALNIVASDSNFTLFLIDYEMPEMDGVQLAEGFREYNIDLSKVIMISSAIYGEEIQHIKALQLGAYLYKPLKRAELLQQISQVIYADDVIDVTKADEEDEEEAVTMQTKSILLIEDNDDNRLLVKAFLKNEDYVVFEAEHGEIGVKMFTENHYDLVLMDVQMPIMDGHQATREIRAWERLHKKQPTPIIALTAHAIREEIDKCIDAGCDTHLGKPIKKLTLLATIEKYI